MTEMKLVHVPLQQLHVSGQNVRKVAPDPDKLRELTASIDALGLLVPLIVSGNGAGAMVIGGRRRLAAMQQLVTDGKWEPDQPVGCVLISDGNAGDTAESFELGRRNMELSLAENTGREDLHPVDQAEAFRVLREQEGATDKELASRFGVSGRTVQRRLRMAQAAPQLRKRCRDGELPLGVLEAACIEPDHKLQVDAVEAAGLDHNPAAAVTSYLKREAVVADSRLGAFVGLERYEAAGGAVSRDLFADGDGRTLHYMDDKALVQRLMMERLREEASIEAAVNGWPEKQIKCAVDVPWNYHSQWEHSTVTKFSSLPKRARPGAVLHLGAGWHGEIERLALVQKGMPGAPASSPIGEDGSPSETATPLPVPLLIELRAMRLSVLRRVLSEAPDEIARDLLTFALARRIYVRDHSSGQAVGLGVGAMAHPDLADTYGNDRLPTCVSQADAALSEREEGLLGWVGDDSHPADEDLQWARFREMAADQRQQLLTCCAARMLTPSRPGANWVDRAIHGAIQVGWPALFDPGEAVLSRLTKAQLMEIARRDFPPGQFDIDTLGRLKKAELVEHIATASAEYRAANGESPWLPAEVFGD